MTLDQKARMVIVAAFLYYRSGASTMTDAEYDALTREIAQKWDRLARERRFSLGSPEELLTTGYHIRVTRLAAESAMLEYRRLGLDPAVLRLPRAKDWRYCSLHRFQYCSAGG